MHRNSLFHGWKRVLPIIVAIVVSTTSSACNDSPSESEPTRTPIVFAFYPQNDITQADLYVVGEDGRNVRQITSLQGAEREPTWSPDGRRIAFTRSAVPVLDSANIFVVNADGTGLTQLTWTGRKTSPAWSPEGRRIAHWSNSGLSVMDVNGSNGTHIPGTDGAAQEAPSWSPDGRRLALSRHLNIWTVNVDGSDLVQVTSNNCGDYTPRWSPDGSRLAFRGCLPGGGTGVFIVNVDGTGRRQLTDFAATGLAWSPDGTKIVFDGPRNSDWDLFVVDVNGGSPVNITRTPGQFEMFPDWLRW